MYPPAFEYRRPTTVDEAVAALGADDAQLLAGGQSLLRALKARNADPGTLVDISQLETIAGIERDETVGQTVIGAAATDADVIDDGRLATHAPMVAEAIGAVGDRQIRNRGTVGGNLVQADAGADIPAAAVAAGAEAIIRGPAGRRTVDVADLYGPAPADGIDEGAPAAQVGSEELVTAIQVPDAGPAGGAYVRKTHQATGYATVGIAARIWTIDGEVSKAAVVATGIHRVPIRLSATEDALVGQPLEDAPRIAKTHAAEHSDPAQVRSDPNVSGTYRLQLLGAYTEGAVEDAIGRATGVSHGE